MRDLKSDAREALSKLVGNIYRAESSIPAHRIAVLITESSFWSITGLGAYSLSNDFSTSSFDPLEREHYKKIGVEDLTANEAERLAYWEAKREGREFSERPRRVEFLEI